MLRDTGTSSHKRQVRKTLLQLSMCGILGGIVVDDAHVVVEWGNSFRWSTSDTADAHLTQLVHISGACQTCT